jgi:hypothetical protein
LSGNWKEGRKVRQYAQDTQVTTDKSKSEIENTLKRYGASKFGYMWDEETNRCVVSFVISTREVRIQLPMPDKAAKEFTRTPTGLLRSPQSAKDAYEQACRQRWRALALVIKAKLEAVTAGISTVEREFFTDTVTPTGETVYERLHPQLDNLLSGRPGQLLLTN